MRAPNERQRFFSYFQPIFSMNNFNISPRRSRPTHRAFTLIEMMVALGILAILLVIIVLPLRLAFDSLNASNAQSLTQSSLDTTMTQFETDLRQAVYVFPNTRVPGVTDRPPYNGQLPYYLSTDATDTGEPGKGTAGNPKGIACSGTAKPWSDPARIDMIQVRRDASGNVLTPLAPSYNIVTYYARRQQLDKDYDPVDNPVVMYRAEYPAFGIVTATNAPDALRVQSPSGALNAPIDFARPADCTAATTVNRSSLWLSHNVYGEADLLPLTEVGKTNAPAEFQPDSNYTIKQSSYSHNLAIPRGLALETTNGYRAVPGYTVPVAPSIVGEAPLVPDTTFTCADTNGDHKIDRVTISLGLASFNVGAQGKLKNNQPVGTVLRATRTVNLPNIQ